MKRIVVGVEVFKENLLFKQRKRIVVGLEFSYAKCIVQRKHINVDVSLLDFFLCRMIAAENVLLREGEY